MAGPIETISTDPSLSLAYLNQVITQQEALLGPLISISNDGQVTLLSFDVTADPPERHTVVTVGALPAGAIAITVGKVFIDGALTDVNAYRF
jgi:hypothetical protein